MARPDRVLHHPGKCFHVTDLPEWVIFGRDRYCSICVGLIPAGTLMRHIDGDLGHPECYRAWEPTVIEGGANRAPLPGFGQLRLPLLTSVPDVDDVVDDAQPGGGT